MLGINNYYYIWICLLPDGTGYMSQSGYSYHPIRTAWIMSLDRLKQPTTNTLNCRIRFVRLKRQRRSHYHYQCSVVVVIVVDIVVDIIVVVVVDVIHCRHEIGSTLMTIFINRRTVVVHCIRTRVSVIT